MKTTNNTRRAWNCSFCHATNVSARCGCAASRKADGRDTTPAVSVDDIEIELPARGGKVRAVTLVW